MCPKINTIEKKRVRKEMMCEMFRFKKNGLYHHFLDNIKTVNHHSILYGNRELNSNEKFHYCFNKTPDQNLSTISFYIKLSNSYLSIRLFLSWFQSSMAISWIHCSCFYNNIFFDIEMCCRISKRNLLYLYSYIFLNANLLNNNYLLKIAFIKIFFSF